ncbi:MAG TPA: hypothetical protein DC049_14450 [Spirochaetia bacterium]|nr:hypothetical protein [Spirochaetia bacterium]
MPVFLSGVKELKTFSAQNGYYSFNVPPGMYSLFATNLQYPFLPKSTNVTVISTSLYDVNFIHNIDPYAKNTADKNNFTLLSDRIIKLDQNNFYIRIYNHNQKDIQGIITLHSIAGKTIEKIYDGAMNYGELEFLFSEHIKLSMGVYIIQIVTYFGTNKKRSYWVVSIL